MNERFVVCIDDETFHDVYPKVGEICEVLKVRFYEGKNYYLLKGYDHYLPDGKRYGYNTECFRPIEYSFGEWVESTLMKEFELQTKLNPCPKS